MGGQLDPPRFWIILICFRDTSDYVNLGICKHEFKFTCRGYCRFTLQIHTDFQNQCGIKLFPFYLAVCFAHKLNSRIELVCRPIIGTTKELWPRSKRSLEMTSKLGIPVSVTSNPEAGKLALNMDIQTRSGRT